MARDKNPLPRLRPAIGLSSAALCIQGGLSCSTEHVIRELLVMAGDNGAAAALSCGEVSGNGALVAFRSAVALFNKASAVPDRRVWQR
jgi:hypothetical protein